MVMSVFFLNINFFKWFSAEYGEYVGYNSKGSPWRIGLCTYLIKVSLVCTMGMFCIEMTFMLTEKALIV